jgi:hypothetical protein
VQGAAASLAFTAMAAMAAIWNLQLTESSQCVASQHRPTTITARSLD